MTGMVPPPDYTADEMAAHDASAEICADGSQNKGTLSESAPRGANHFGQKRGECGRTFVGIVQGKTAVPTTEKYTGEGREIFFCVFSKKEVHFGKRIIMNIDRNALFRLTDIREVLRNVVGDK